MKDRIPTYPGRVILTPVEGQENTYDITRADEPLEEGTPLNKATLLADATAELFGLTSEATPNEVLVAAYEAIASGAGAAKVEFVSYIGTGTYGASNPCSLTFSFAPKLIAWLAADNVDYLSPVISPFYQNSSVLVDQLTTSYVVYGGVGYNNLSTGYGKISEDGKTYSWYNTYTVQSQNNSSELKYYVMAIG